MSDLNSDIEKIIGIYKCDQLISFFYDTSEILKLYDVTDENDWVRDIVGEQDVRNVRIARTAFLLSRLAHNHADLLKKVKRVAPGFWQRAEKQKELADVDKERTEK